jgi:hypothetical protein
MACEIRLPDKFLPTSWNLTNVVLPPSDIMSQHVLGVVVPPGEPFISAQVAAVCGIGGISVSSVPDSFSRYTNG